jgi:uncharacterized membrane protein YphA (DoxX/SURF4 family)
MSARFPWARVDQALGRRVSMRALAVLRAAAGLVTLLHLRPFLENARHGFIYRDAFYRPYASWYPELPRALYIAMLWIAVVAAIAMAAGLFTRVTTVTTFAIVTYNLFLSTTNMHNNRAYLLVVLAVLAVAPCGREFSADAWLRARRGRPALDTDAPAWPLLLLRFEACVVYGASGVSKLLDPDWIGGRVTWDRMVHQRHYLQTRTPTPDWLISVLTDRTFHTFAAKVIVLTELFIAVGLAVRATRYAAVWVAVGFHVAIELSASVEAFSYIAIAALVIWAVPSTRDRVLEFDPTDTDARRFIAFVRALDWLARFRVVAAPPGSPIRIVDRDGTTTEGGPAEVFALSRLPVTAWFALPLLLLPSVREARRAPALRGA